MWYVTDGNHEDHESLDALPVRDDGLRELAPGVLHCPRGLVLVLEGKRWMFFGGAVSVDKPGRTPGRDWFDREVASQAEFLRACEAGRVDVLVVHDVPLGSKFWRTHLQQDRPAWRRETPWRTGMLVASDQHQRMLGELVSVVQPGVLFHGHHHMRVETQIGEAEVHGLGCNGMGQASWMIVDETGEVIIG